MATTIRTSPLCSWTLISRVSFWRMRMRACLRSSTCTRISLRQQTTARIWASAASIPGSRWARWQLPATSWSSMLPRATPAPIRRSSSMWASSILNLPMRPPTAARSSGASASSTRCLRRSRTRARNTAAPSTCNTQEATRTRNGASASWARIPSLCSICTA